jgi:hypothetical protein
MYTNKIWLNSKQLWRCKIYLDSWDLYDDVTEEHLLDLIDILRKVEYNWEKVKLAYD